MTSAVPILNGIMLVLFLSWAGFQYNDPDPLLWIVVYSLAALGCLLFLFGRLSRKVGLTFAGLCLAGALYLLVQVIVDREFIFAEQGREMIGLLVIAGWIGFLSSRPSTSTLRTA